MKKMKFRIVAFGDSMTKCSAQVPAKRWPALLQSKLNATFKAREFEVINAGVGGNTSREGLARIKTDVLAYSPNLTLVEFGGNDATTDHLRSVSFAEFDRNLSSIARLLKTVGSAIAWLSFPPVLDMWHGANSISSIDAFEKFYPMGGINQYIHEYRRRVRLRAQKNKDLFIDLYGGIRDVLEQDHPARFILSDGVHFTDIGARLAADIVFNSLVTRKSTGRCVFKF